MYDTKEIIEKFIVVAVENDNNLLSIENSLNELSELINTSGAETVGQFVQKRETIHRAHYLGSGKVQELKDYISLLNATGIVCDDELTSSQQRNMTELLDAKVIDRTTVILDIFAQRASTAEGKVQVELAQQRYNLSHLVGLGKSLSRLGGGIGTRGPGEKKLETDRRYIKDRIVELNQELKEIETHREVLRVKRKRNSIPVIALVGYTNAGKSTLLNTLSGSDVLAMDKLFATLDTTTRKVKLPGGSKVLFVDTVGFIQKLPHSLIKAFRATLEEVKYADILMHVVDSSSIIREEQMKVVYKTLEELDCKDKPIITVFNKSDKDIELPFPNDANALKTATCSAINEASVANIMIVTENLLKSFRKSFNILIPYEKGTILNFIHGNSEIIKEEHLEKGTFLEVYASEDIKKRLEEYIC